MRVLFVEDDKFFASAYANALEARGIQVFYTDDATDALRLADEEQPVDAVILDIMMPYDETEYDAYETLLGRRTGIELLKELRVQLPESKFIALTNLPRP
jgi:CheY-like chemotaxis protein